MHEFRRPGDGVDGTGLNTQRAADAVALVDYSHPKRRGLPVPGIERLDGKSHRRGQFGDDGVTTRNAAINVGLARRDGSGVWLTSLIAALRALRLRKEEVKRALQFAVLDSAGRALDL